VDRFKVLNARQDLRHYQLRQEAEKVSESIWLPGASSNCGRIFTIRFQHLEVHSPSRSPWPRTWPRLSPSSAFAAYILLRGSLAGKPASGWTISQYQACQLHKSSVCMSLSIGAGGHHLVAGCAKIGQDGPSPTVSRSPHSTPFLLHIAMQRLAHTLDLVWSLLKRACARYYHLQPDVIHIPGRLELQLCSADSMYVRMMLVLPFQSVLHLFASVSFFTSRIHVRLGPACVPSDRIYYDATKCMFPWMWC
jgi:hypothetical protein